MYNKLDIRRRFSINYSPLSVAFKPLLWPKSIELSVDHFLRIHTCPVQIHSFIDSYMECGFVENNNQHLVHHKRFQTKLDDNDAKQASVAIEME